MVIIYNKHQLTVDNKLETGPYPYGILLIDTFFLYFFNFSWLLCDDVKRFNTFYDYIIVLVETRER